MTNNAMKFEMLVENPGSVDTRVEKELNRILFTPYVNTTKQGKKYYTIQFRTGVKWNIFINDFYYTNVQLWFDEDARTRRFYSSPLKIPTHNIMQSFAWSSGLVKTGVILPRLTSDDNPFLLIPKGKHRKEDYYIFQDSWTGDYDLNDDLSMWY